MPVLKSSQTFIVFLAGTAIAGSQLLFNSMLGQTSLRILFFSPYIVAIGIGLFQSDRKIAMRDGLAFGIGLWLPAIVGVALATPLSEFLGLLVIIYPFAFMALYTIVPVVVLAWVGSIFRRLFFS